MVVTFVTFCAIIVEKQLVKVSPAGPVPVVGGFVELKILPVIGPFVGPGCSVAAKNIQHRITALRFHGNHIIAIFLKILLQQIKI